MTRPGRLNYRMGGYDFACGLCGTQSRVYHGSKMGAAMAHAAEEGCSCSLVHGWLCPGCAAFYAATGGHEAPEELLPF